MRNIIKFNDLSIWLKIPIVFIYILIFFYLIAFIIGIFFVLLGV